MGLEPGDTFVSATGQLLAGAAELWTATTLPLPGWLLLTLGVALAIGIPALLSWRSPRAYLFTAAPVYLLMMAVSAASTRIDPIGQRFLFPVLPLAAISVAVLAWRVLPLLPQSLLVRRGIIALLFMAPLLRGQTALRNGVTPLDTNYSPETLGYVRQAIEPGSTFAANRYGAQVYAVTLDYQVINLPWDDATGYNRAFGIHPLSEAEALDLFARSGVRYVVFFMGRKFGDGILDRGEYGPFVSDLYHQRVPLVGSVTRLADGVVLELRKPVQP